VQESRNHELGEPNRTSDVNNPYLFTGRRYDPETARKSLASYHLFVECYEVFDRSVWLAVVSGSDD
jgi:hypothetical protein